MDDLINNIIVNKMMIKYGNIFYVVHLKKDKIIKTYFRALKHSS